MYTSSFHLKIISGIEKKRPKDLSRLLLSYEDQNGFGFIDTETFIDHIQSTLVYKTIVLQRVFEPIGAKFSSEQQAVYEQAGFEIYPGQKILQSHVGGKRLQKIVSGLSDVLKYKISFSDVFANIPDILRKLAKQQLEFSIVAFSVNNFRPQVGLTGKFSAIVSDSRAAKKTINAYEGDILDIQLRLDYEEPSYWYIASTGKVVVKAPDKDTLLNDVDLVKNLLMEN
jgi:hypothetical protein